MLSNMARSAIRAVRFRSAGISSTRASGWNGKSMTGPQYRRPGLTALDLGSLGERRWAPRWSTKKMEFAARSRSRFEMLTGGTHDTLPSCASLTGRGHASERDVSERLQSVKSTFACDLGRSPTPDSYVRRKCCLSWLLGKAPFVVLYS